jgi:hypothetical protein
MGQNENYTALFAFIELNFGGAGVKNNEKSENSKKNCLKKILYWRGVHLIYQHMFKKKT